MIVTGFEINRKSICSVHTFLEYSELILSLFIHYILYLFWLKTS